MNILFFAAFIIRIASIFILKFHINPDTWEPHQIAANILAGKGYVFDYLGGKSLFYGTSPLYAYIEVLFNNNHISLEIFQALIGALSIIPLYLLTKHLFNKRTAIIAGILYCFHPAIIVYTGKLHDVVFLIAIVLAVLYLAICKRDTFTTNVTIGLLVGAGILLRPTLVLLIFAFFLYFRKRLISPIIIALVAVLVISPWIYRGYRIYNRFIFITTTSSEYLWRGNNPYASGGSLDKNGKTMLDLAPEDFRRKVMSLNEIEQYAFFKDEAIKYIKAHPLLFLKNTIKKFYYFWWFAPQTGFLYPHHWLLLYKIFYSCLGLSFIYGMYFVAKDRIHMPDVILILSILLMVSILHSICYVDARHRWAFESLILIFSAYGIDNIFNTINRNKR